MILLIRKKGKVTTFDLIHFNWDRKKAYKSDSFGHIVK